MPLLEEQIGMLDELGALELRGSVTEVRGLALRVADLPLPVGASVRIGGGQLLGEVVGFDEDEAIVMPFGAASGVRAGDVVVGLDSSQRVLVGEGLLGRVLDGLGRSVDGGGPVREGVLRPVRAGSVDPLERPVIDEPLATGVRAIDALSPIGRGQRLGIFAAPGVGKSTLLASIARQTEAEVNVIALVGERGREVRDFLENALGEEGLKRSVVVCATGDEPALLRIRAAEVASAVAEHFRDAGRDVLLLMDSVTRFCQAQRQVGLAAGEPPATRGYPPSVFSMLPQLLERSGRTERGSITGLYAVLVEGDDMNEPVADACRGVLDGHVLLSRSLAERGHFPAIDVLGSISRVAEDVVDADHQAARREILRTMGDYRQVEDLLNLGAYTEGSNPAYDTAITMQETINQLLQQGRTRGGGDFEKTRAQTVALGEQIRQTRQEVERRGRRSGGGGQGGGGQVGRGR